MPGRTLDEDADATVVRALHGEGNCRGRGRTMQTRTRAPAGFAAALLGGLVTVGILRRIRLRAGLSVIGTRRAIVGGHCHDLIRCCRGRGHVRHGMRQFPEDELGHQQENYGPAMEMKARHECSVAATRWPCNRNRASLPDMPYSGDVTTDADSRVHSRHALQRTASSSRARFSN